MFTVLTCRNFNYLVAHSGGAPNATFYTDLQIQYISRSMASGLAYGRPTLWNRMYNSDSGHDAIFYTDVQPQ